MKRICVYCASSRRCDPMYRKAAERLGRLLARDGLEVIYGGARLGLMGALADGVLAEGGSIIGVLPRFMQGREFEHPGLTELRLVNDMHERKRVMLEGSDAFIALPGGCGTFEELFEAITWKRLGLHTAPILLVNVEGYFDPCVLLLQRCIQQRFMDARHDRMWTLVASVEEVLDALAAAPRWADNALDFASP